MGYESIGHRLLKFSVNTAPPRKAGLVSCLPLVSLDITYELGYLAAREAYLVKILYEAFQELSTVCLAFRRGYLQVIKV